MWYSVYGLNDWTFGGYWVPAVCTHPKCRKEINRWVQSICGWDPHSDEFRCTLNFCEDHLTHIKRDGEDVELCARCIKKRPPSPKKPECRERVNHIKKDKSRAPRRKENKKLLEKRDKEAIEPAEETEVLAWLCDKDYNPIDDLWIKTLSIDKWIIWKDWRFKIWNIKFLFYSDKLQNGEHNKTNW